MNFISLTFVFSFPVVVLLYWKIPWKYRELFLLAVSYFFYIKESSWAGGLLLLTTAITYLAGIAVEKGQTQKSLADFGSDCMSGISDRSEIFSPASGNLILYLPDNGICDRCVSWRNFSGKKSFKLCSVCIVLSTAGCRSDRESR